MIKKIKVWIKDRKECHKCGETKGLISYFHQGKLKIMCENCEEDKQWYYFILEDYTDGN